MHHESSIKPIDPKVCDTFAKWDFFIHKNISAIFPPSVPTKNRSSWVQKSALSQENIVQNNLNIGPRCMDKVPYFSYLDKKERVVLYYKYANFCCS